MQPTIIEDNTTNPPTVASLLIVVLTSADGIVDDDVVSKGNLILQIIHHDCYHVNDNDILPSDRYCVTKLQCIYIYMFPITSTTLYSKL